MNGETFLNESNVSITKTMARIGETSYPINGIGSISVVAGEDKGMGFWAVAVICGVIGLFSLPSGFGVVMVLVAGILVVAALNQKKEFHLVFRTASGDTQALTSEDRSYLERVKNAVEQAVAARR